MTIMGQHTIAETKELIDQKQSDINAYQKAYDIVLPKWKQKNEGEALEWGKDFEDFRIRWGIAVVKAKALMFATGSVMVSDSITPAEPAFQIVLEALQRTPGRFQKGDFADLVDRWSRVGLPSPRIITRQPDSFDVDLEGFKVADAAAKKIESTASNPWLWAGVGVAGVAGFLYLTRK